MLPSSRILDSLDYHLFPEKQEFLQKSPGSDSKELRTIQFQLSARTFPLLTCSVRLCYIQRRPHWALVPEGGGDPVTPLEVYEGKVRPQLPRWQARAREAKAKLDVLRERPAA